MSLNPSFEIRRMTRNELDLAVEWAAIEGWNPGLHDAQSFFETDPQGYFIAIANGEPIGCISAVAYDETFGFIGFFIVRPLYRGHQVGLELGRKALEYLGQRNIGVDGVEAKIKNYETYGFRLAYNNIRCEGHCAPGPRPEGLVPASSLVFNQLAAFDRLLFPVPRPVFLSAWLRQPESTALAAVEGGQIKGYGVIRPCRVGYKIGPLFAGDLPTAERLLDGLTAQAPAGAPFYLDIPAANAAAVDLVHKRQMKAVFKTARMYNKTFPPLPLDRLFGVTSFELG